MDDIGRKPARYEIRVGGVLSDHWSDWLGGMTLTVTRTGEGDTVTTLTGVVPDQSALRGILSKLWDLNLTLISVSRIGSVAND